MTEAIGGSVRGRLAYVPIHRRPALHLPNDARVAVWTIVNVENWSPTGAMPRAVLPPVTFGSLRDPETLVAAYERGAPESELLRQPDGPMASPQGL